MSNESRKSLLKLIQSNIAQHGHHIYLISGGCLPRFAYTVGLSETLGAELLLAGAVIYSAEEVKRIINEVAVALSRHHDPQDLIVVVDSLGSFSLRKADDSWTTSIILGALDYYDKKMIPALQIVPDQDNWTIDIPDMSKPWSITAEPIWQWLHESWDYSIPSNSVAITNLRALRGEKITEAVRWENDQWELFVGAGTDVSKEEMRVVPLGNLLAMEDFPEFILSLQVGSGLWREAAGFSWQPWA
jgi:Domain of unknown function (DUF4262)